MPDEFHPSKGLIGGNRRAARVEDLLQRALKHSERRSFADRSFIRPLERLIAACNEEADLSAFGAHTLQFDTLRCLRNLLQFDALEAVCPSVLSRPIREPVFISGMPRSGTTFLHRLILQDARIAAPSLFQLIYPDAWRASRMGAALRKGWLNLQLSLLAVCAPELNALHPVAADAPEECTDIMAHVFQSLRFESMYRVPSYKSWLQREGLLEAYRFHRRFLQHLDAQAPGRRWVLKSPDHLFALDELRAVYPDARLVLVHRDPVRVLASVAKLTEVLRRAFARNIDRMEIGRQVCGSWTEGAQKMCELADSDSVLHLHYRQVISSPLDAVRAVYRHCGIELTGDAEERMQRWLHRMHKARRQPRRYDLAQFGLDARSIRERFVQYTQTFGVDMELEGRGAGARVPS
jgi:hypothetical protein